MELSKKSIHMSHRVSKAEHMVTIDDDFIVPDVKPDIDRKIKETADVVIEKVRQIEGKVSITGYLCYHLLYAAGSSCSAMEGKIAFDELIVMPEITPQDLIRCCSMLQDITITVINSRKISVKAIISMEITAERILDKEAVTGMQTENLQLMKKRFCPLELCISRKDIFRIRESMNLPSDRRNVGEILWYEVYTEGLEARMSDGYVNIKGDLVILCIYTPEDDPDGMNYYSDSKPFSGRCEVDGCKEDMYPDIAIAISEKSVIARPDANGEMRIIDTEVILDLDIRGYMEEEYEIMSDAYSPSSELKAVEESIDYETFMIKNSVKCHADDRFAVGSDEPVLQLMNASGKINIDDMTCNDEGVLIEGSITLDVMYLKPDDKIGFVRHEIPFSHQADIEGICSDSIISNNNGTFDISATVVSGNEIEAKCNVLLDIFAKEARKGKIITDVKAGPPDMEYYKNLPGITGYITKPGDSLWDIAKRFCTTIDRIVGVNGLSGEDITPGTKLIILKSTAK